MASFPLFGAPAAPAPAPALAPATGRTSPVPGRTTEAVVPNIVAGPTTISGSVGEKFEFTGVTGYTVPFKKYNEIFGTVASPAATRAASPSAFASPRNARSTRAASPVQFTDDAAAAAALRASPP